MMDCAVQRAVEFMRPQGIDGWLVYDFRGSNPVMRQLLPNWAGMTRRGFFYVPATGAKPILLAHAIEVSHSADGERFRTVPYSSRLDLIAKLGETLLEGKTVAMEYSPDGQLPTVSWVDGGTLDMVRACGVEVVSSADLYQAALTTWSADALRSHRVACEHVVEVKDAAFEFISTALEQGTEPTEFEVQQIIDGELTRRGLDTDHPAIVAVNANSGDPHYAPDSASALPIGRDDWVLIDLWARLPGEENIFGDITWVGFTGPNLPKSHGAIFDTVRRARDSVLSELYDVYQQGRTSQGWELDRIARDSIMDAGYGEHFPHRTGHSLGVGPSVHGMGVNLDDLESKDTRSVLPGVGFTVEPGIYLPEFGVRLEVNVYMNPDTGPEITTPVQDRVIAI